MNKAVVLIIELAGLLATTSLVQAAELASTPAPARVAAITARDGSGRAQRFMDSHNREFAVKYDAQQRVQSVEATSGAHINDIVSVGYAPNGKLVGVRFRTGYTLFFDTQPDGAQVIRDSLGNALIRTGRVTQAVEATAADQSAKLAAAVTEFEALLSALGQSPR